MQVRKRLMTIPGVDMVVALAIVAAIGNVGRFEQSQKLVSYLGLNPSVRQSGSWAAYHGLFADHEAGPWACARHARRSGLGGSASAGSVACVLPASPGTPAAVSMSPLSRLPVSSRCSSGIC